MMKKLLFIYNPNSGKGVIASHLDEILDTFRAAGYEADVYRTEKRLDGRDKAAAEGADYELLVCAGGDGTLNEVVSGLMQLDAEQRPAVGLIPAGSTNDTRRSYNLPMDIKKAAQIAVSGSKFATDIGSFNDDKSFAYVASFGNLSAVSCFTPQDLKKVFGRAAYIGEGIKQLIKMTSSRLTINADGQSFEGDYLLGMVANAVSVGGFEGIMGRDIDLQDGQFEVILIKRPKDLGAFCKIVNGVLSAKGAAKVGSPDDLVFRFKASHVEFVSDNGPVQWVVDGEDAGTCEKVTVVNNCRAISIMAGEKTKK